MADPLEGRTGVDRKTGRPVIRDGGRWIYADTAKLTQDQGQAQGYAKLMAGAEKSYRQALREGYDPATLRNAFASVLEGLPFGGLDGAGALVRDDVSDRGRQAEMQWSDAQLRAMSGAAAPEPEVKRNVRTYFTRPGQSLSEIGPQMERARQTAFEAARRRSGPASREIPSAAPQHPPSGVRRYNPKTGRIE